VHRARKAGNSKSSGYESLNLAGFWAASSAAGQLWQSPVGKPTRRKGNADGARAPPPLGRAYVALCLAVPGTGLALVP
jgi:hypothetical protein